MCTHVCAIERVASRNNVFEQPKPVKIQAKWPSFCCLCGLDSRIWRSAVGILRGGRNGIRMATAKKGSLVPFQDEEGIDGGTS